MEMVNLLESAVCLVLIPSTIQNLGQYWDVIATKGAEMKLDYFEYINILEHISKSVNQFQWQFIIYILPSEINDSYGSMVIY